MNPQKVVVLSGAGLSAPSGLSTFRDSGGLWAQHKIEDVATPEGWQRNPRLVLDFYNARRTAAARVKPNAGHKAIADLERFFDVVVVTQNVDDLHERAGSTRIIHLHGELNKARSTADHSQVYDIQHRPIRYGERCPLGAQLRPHIVWFGEEVMHMEEAEHHVAESGLVLVVGTSLTVYPAAGLIHSANDAARKYLVDLNPAERPQGFEVIQGSADHVLPPLLRAWCEQSLADGVRLNFRSGHRPVNARRPRPQAVSMPQPAPI